MPYQLWKDRNYEVIACKTLDGDTVDVLVAEEYPPREWHRIRLHGIDAPEREQPYGEDAKLGLQHQIANSPRLFVYITQETELYGRHVGILHQGNRQDSLNAYLVREGLAYAYFADDYQYDQQIAQWEESGVWQQYDGGIRPWVYRRETQRQSEPVPVTARHEREPQPVFQTARRQQDTPPQPEESGGCHKGCGAAVAAAGGIIILVMIIPLIARIC